MEDEDGIGRTLTRIAHRLSRHAESVVSEEAIKTVLVAPLLTALGHDPSDPELVLVGHKTSEGRADYVVLGPDGAQTMVVAITSNPDDTESARALSLAALAPGGASVAHLTDGRRHRFHLLSAEGIAPETFLTFDIGDDIDPGVLMPLSRGAFSIEDAIRAGRTTRPADLAWDHLLEQADVTGELHALLSRHLVTHGVAQERADAAVGETLERVAQIMRGEMQAVANVATAAEEVDEAEERRPLTGNEQAATEIVREIVGRYVDPALVFVRPAKSYLALNYTDNNRKTICRLYLLSQSARYVGTFVGRDEKKQRIAAYDNVVDHAEAILVRLREIDPGAFHGRTIELPAPTVVPQADASTLAPEVISPSSEEVVAPNEAVTQDGQDAATHAQEQLPIAALADPPVVVEDGFGDGRTEQ